MKKIVAFFLALSMAVVMLAGCGASQTPTTTEAPKAETKAATEAAPAAETEQKELTIAGIVFKDEFTMKMVQQGYEDAAKDYGVNIVIGNSMGDLANEQQLVYSYIDMGVDGIAITPYSEEASIPILKEAYDKGIEVAVANIKLNDASFVCGGFTSQDLLNGQKLGDYTAKYLSDKYGNDLKIAIMDFDATIPEQSKARYGGFLEKLTANGVNYEIVAQQSSTSKNDKALSQDPKVLILDEPTSALAKAEVEKLFAAIRKVKENDVIIIYISHKLAEIHEIADTVTVLRDAQYVGKKNIEEIDNAGMIAMMFGKTEIRKRPADVVPTDEPVMEVKHLTRAGWYEDISFTLYKGEVLGIAGVLGSGRTELLGGIFGSDPADSGEVIIEGKTYIRRTPAIMKNAGLGLTPEDRKTTGLILKHSIESNLCYAGMKKTTINGWVESRKKRKEMSERQVKALQIKLSSISAKASSMSGGNQQKVVVGNWLNNDPKIMIYDEPTRGIDVNAKQQIFEIMWNQAKQGNSSIFVSTELEELPGVCNRILVLRGGRITEELTTEKIDSMTTNDLYTLCMGGHSSEREN